MAEKNNISELEIGQRIQVETGITNWDKRDNEFFCKVIGYDENGRIILESQNAVCLDGRNTIRPFFSVAPEAPIQILSSGDHKLTGCYVLFHCTGLDRRGRLILKTP